VEIVVVRVEVTEVTGEQVAEQEAQAVFYSWQVKLLQTLAED
jgi:hypothetical protein